jgi:hypothetical protein
VRIGTTIVVELAPDPPTPDPNAYPQWTPASSNNASVQSDGANTFVAAQSGTATLSANETWVCVGPCPFPPKFWQVQINVVS